MGGPAAWILSALSEPDGTPFHEAAALRLRGGGLGGVRWGAYRREGMTAQVVELLKTARYATAGGYALGRCSSLRMCS